MQFGIENMRKKWLYMRLTVKFGVWGQIGGNGYIARQLAAKLMSPKTVTGIRRIVDHPRGNGEICGKAKLLYNLIFI